MSEFFASLKATLSPNEAIVFSGGLAVANLPSNPGIQAGGVIVAASVPIISFVQRIVHGAGHWLYAAGGAGMAASVAGLVLGSWAYSLVDIYPGIKGDTFARFVRLIGPTVAVGGCLGIISEAFFHVPRAVAVLKKGSEPTAMSRAIGIILGTLVVIALFFWLVSRIKSVTDDLDASGLTTVEQGNVQAWQALMILFPFTLSVNWLLARIHRLDASHTLLITLFWALPAMTCALWLAHDLQLGAHPTGTIASPSPEPTDTSQGYKAVTVLFIWYLASSVPPLLQSRRAPAQPHYSSG